VAIATDAGLVAPVLRGGDRPSLSGAVTARWMSAFISLLEEPVRILV